MTFAWDEGGGQNSNQPMSNREPTRWQHNRLYPYPINPCVYTYDLICNLQFQLRF